MIIRGIPLIDAKLMCSLFNSWHPVAFVYVFPTVLLMSCSVGEHFYIINVFVVERKVKVWQEMTMAWITCSNAFYTIMSEYT